MKVLQVIPAFYPATYWGGPIESAYGLCNALAAMPGVEVRVLTTDSAGPLPNDRLKIETVPVTLPAGYEVYYCKRTLGMSFSLGFHQRLIPLLRWADIVHLHAVYSAPVIPTLLGCKVLNKCVVWSPRGALQRWHGASRPLAKGIWETICNSLCDARRVVLHFTSKLESDDSVNRITRATTVVIPNGVYVSDEDEGRTRADPDVLRLLYIGRLHPIKGIENLLQAVARLNLNFRLTIAGTGAPRYCEQLQSLTGEWGLNEKVSFVGHVMGARKESCFWETDVCVVPSFLEAFAMVVAEALAHAVPVIASTGTPWKEVEAIGCGLWVGNEPEALVRAIERISEMPLEEMGNRGRKWIGEQYSWESVATRIFKSYEGLIG